MIDLDPASADPDIRIPLATTSDPAMLETVRRIITPSDLGNSVSELILGRLFD